jgi:site-specific DNA recombinase
MNDRVLGNGRLGRDREESTSEGRQRRSANGTVAMIEGTLISWASESGVSGRMSPFEREKLGPWLKPINGGCETGACAHSPNTPYCMGQWDVLSAWKMDRITRRALHFHQLMEWMKANTKYIVASNVNTTSKAGRRTAELMAMFVDTVYGDLIPEFNS